MDDSQIEQAGMFIKVKTFLNKKATELAATPIIASTIQAALNSAIDKVFTEDEDASADVSGSTEVKRELRQQVEGGGFEIGAACVAYYTMTVPDPRLRVKCEYERNDLVRMRDVDLYVKMKALHEIADPIKALLSGFGVTGTDVDDFGTAVNDFYAELEGPKDAIGERAASGMQVDRNIDAVKEILVKQLDVVMKYYVINNAELHDYYLRARAIDQTGGGPIPDEDEEITITSGTFSSSPALPEVVATSRIVVTNGASNACDLKYGFSNIPAGFSGTVKTLTPGNTGNDIAADLGFAPGTNIIVFQNTASPPPGASITIRVKVYY